MADLQSWSRLRRRIAVALLAVLLPVALLASGARGATSPVQGWLGAGAPWPQRALVVFAPRGASVTPAKLKVTENGARTGRLRITPLSQAGARDFGLVVLLARSQSMAGAPLDGAVGSVRSLAGARAGAQQLGVISLTDKPSGLVPLTSDGSAISRGLAHVPPAGTSARTDIPGAITLALAQLSQAHLAMGAIVVVSDGVGRLTVPGGTPADSVRAAAAAANVPVFAVGVQDGAATARSLQALGSVVPGQLVQAPPARLAGVMREIAATVTRGYVARWQSTVRPGASVDIRASLAGAGGEIHAVYASPAANVAAPAAPASRPLSKADFSLAHGLSSAPGFAIAPVAPPIASSTPPAPAAASSNSSFWNSQQGTLAFAAVVGLLISIAVMLAFYRPARRAVRTRVSSYLPGPESEDSPITLIRANRSKGGLFGRIEQSRWWPPFVENVQIAGSQHTPVALVKRAAIAGVMVGLLVTLISGTPLLGFLPIFAWPWVLRKLVARKAGKMREKFRDTLPTYLQDLASAMRVGRSFVAALTVVMESADEPLHTEFERVIADEALGRPLEEALDDVAARMQATDLSQVALIAGLNRRSGSNVSEALDRVAEGARERADLRREIKALTGQAKMSSWVLTALPGVLLVGINLVSPLYAHPLFHTTIGIVLLGVGTTMVFMGWKVLSKITSVEA